MSDLARDELAAIRQLLADHEQILYPAGKNGLPEPTRYVKTGHDMDGLYWDVSNGKGGEPWTVVARFDEHEETPRCIYIHTPDSLRGPREDSLGDVVPMTYMKARELAASILAALNYSDNALNDKRRSS
jgi:hypothetical protein